MAPEVIVINMLNLANLKCSPTAVSKLEEGHRELPLARFYGKASEIASRDNKNSGVSEVFFRGTFEGVNLQKGTTMKSAKLMLPKNVSDVVQKAIEANKDKSSVGFVFEIRAVEASTPNGYTYKALAVRPPQVEDELAELRALASKAPKVEQMKRSA